MADEELDKTKAEQDAEADGYYGEDEMDGEDLDLSFLDEEDDEKGTHHSA
ncbi:MAG TPA: hypothetical protein VGH44_06300 [Candidatus Saccharimonadia bacterium]|jgi:hypothetical protein